MTAYDVRISDWSSDWCSSDLPPMLEQEPARWADERRGVADDPPKVRQTVRAGDQRLQGDRTSVASGKSVSVSVDSGGRRIVKQKHPTVQVHARPPRT